MRSAFLCWCAVGGFAGCGFAPGLANTDGGDANEGPHDDSGRDGSGSEPAPQHLTDSNGQPGSLDLTLTGSVTITTSSATPTISGMTLASGTFDIRPQLQGGDVAVLHVARLTIAQGAVVRVIGTRPLIVVASGAIEILGIVDASGKQSLPGAGGSAPGEGAAPGVTGIHFGTYSDTGGGGGGFGAAGAAGGAITNCTNTLNGGAPGASTGDDTLTVLIGGSGGGQGESQACSANPGGAGGGAVQLTSATSVHIATSGVINAGGGGGAGGIDCGSFDGNSGAGGGAGGAIVLQAPVVHNEGVVVANGGGGGGSGSGSGGTPGTDAGMPGADGQPSATTASGGAAGGGTSSTTGGSGATRVAVPNPGTTNICERNGGGGGGGVGRIAASSSFIDDGTTSPLVIATLPR